MEISPNILEFQGSFIQPSTEYLTLTNTTKQPLAFKVKTTAPKLYCVRPNAGLIYPDESAEISIILQGFSSPLPSDYKCKDKFLIVSLPARDVRDPARVGDQWSKLEQKYGDQLVSKKLKVNYFITDDDNYDDGNDRSYNDDQPKSRSVGGADSAQGGVNGGGFAGAAAGAGVGAGAAGVLGAKSLGSNRSNGEYSNQNGRSEIYDEQPVQRSVPEPQHQQSTTQQHQQQQSYSAPVVQQQQQQQNQGHGDYQPQKVIATEPVQGISIQLAALLVLISFLIGWLLF